MGPEKWTMKIQIMKFTALPLIILFASFFSLARVTDAAVLKPGEIIYSRAAMVEGNCDTGTVWAVGQDGSNDRLITQGHHPRISPDGRYILFKRFNPSSLCLPFSIAPSWWMRDLATNRETQIANNFQSSSGHYFSPETNRGANQIVESDGAGICLMNIDGTGRVCSNIPNLDPIRGAGHPSVRGTDNLLLVQNFLDNADGGLYTLSYDTLVNRQKIPNTIGRDLSPSWSNDGQTIAFAAFPTGRGEPYFFTNLFKISPNGSNRTQLTFFTQPTGEGFTYSLVWTGDNSTLLNAARLGGVAGIYKISASGGILGTIPISAGAAPEWVGGIVPVYSEQQVASFGGGYTGGGNYSLVDTIGQGFAGQRSTGSQFNFESGFWAIPGQRNKGPFDFDGDGRTDIGIFRATVGEWWINRSSTGNTAAVQFGNSTDRIAPADYTGDGKTDVALFRPSSGEWYVLRSEDSSFFAFPFGMSGDIPVPADYDADGKPDPAVFRPSNATWYISRSSGGTTIAQFGADGDMPVAADYDGDGKADVAIYRPSNGQWWLSRSTAGVIVFQFGISTDKAVQGDYTGDGKTDVAFWRPSSGEWYILRSEDFSFYSQPFGTTGDIPSPGDYDGDGKFDTTVFRPSSATWFVNRSTAGTLIQQFGATGDRPIANAFVP